MVEERIIAMLSKLRPEDPLNSIDIADILWLATQRRRKSSLTASSGTSSEISQSHESPPPVETQRQTPESAKKQDKEEISEQSVSDQDVSVVTPSQTSSTSSTSPTKGLPFAVPAARALPQARQIARALRPLHQKVNSRTQRIIDIPATIDRVSEERILIPVLKPALERCFDVVLVVEKTSAYGIWQPTIKEFEQLLLHQGALRDVRRWYAEPQSDGTLRLQSNPGKSRAVKELIQIGSQRLIFILSDCIDPTWSNGAWQKWCQTWGKHHAVTVIQLLPTAFWRRTQLSQLTKVWQRSETVNPLNQQWRFTDYTGLDETFETPHGFPVPVLPLEPYPLSVWGQGMLGRSPTDLTGYFLNALPLPPSSNHTTITAQARFDSFCQMASAPAKRLAALMSAVPIQLPIVRLIQQTILKQEANATQMAEIFLSGIVQRRGNASDPEKQLYEFYADDQTDIRVLLNRTLPAREIAMVMDCLSADLAQRAGKDIQAFRAMLMAPAEAGVTSELAAEIGEFARVTLKVLKGLGGDYAAFAEALERGETGPAPPSESGFLARFQKSTVTVKVPTLSILEGEAESQFLALQQAVQKIHLNLDPGELYTYQQAALGQGIDPNDLSAQLLFIFDQLTESETLELEEWTGETVFVDRRGEIATREPVTAFYYEEDLTLPLPTSKDVPPEELQILPMLLIPGGILLLETQQLFIPPFWMSQTPITQAQWYAIASRTDLKVQLDLDPNPSRFQKDYQGQSHWLRPIEQVSWQEAIEFCARLTQLTQAPYLLPTEIQWQYACQGLREPPSSGEYPPFHFGETLTGQLANYDSDQTFGSEAKHTPPNQTTPVGLYPPNAFGLQDCHGNVWEWCLDQWETEVSPNQEQSIDLLDKNIVKQLLSNEEPRVIRGGSWDDYPWYCRSANRSRNNPLSSNNNGFRVVCRFPS